MNRILTGSVRGKTVKAVLYDGTDASVSAVSKMLGRQRLSHTGKFLPIRGINGKLQFVDAGNYVVENDRLDFEIVDPGAFII